MTTATKAATLLVWQALTPVHSGTGQSGAGVIDLPIAREVATGFPVLPASSIKGVLRDGEGLKKEEAETITAGDQKYGYVNKKTGEKNEKGEDIRESRESQLTFTDARLLCMPLRSYAGTFAYVTCPLILGRLHRDLKALGLNPPFEVPTAERADAAPALSVQVVNDSVLTHNNKVLFEDIDLDAQKSDYAQQVAKALAKITGMGDDFTRRLAIVPDDIFSYFSETATEVSAHIRLEAESKTVAGGALWYEEALPAESLLTSFVLGPFENTRPLLQIGGKGSVGKGLLKLSSGAV